MTLNIINGIHDESDTGTMHTGDGTFISIIPSETNNFYTLF